ncbi:uncharacterized protein METZ01_LOCUS242819, partial [marine metagenome]
MVNDIEFAAMALHLNTVPGFWEGIVYKDIFPNFP